MADRRKVSRRKPGNIRKMSGSMLREQFLGPTAWHCGRRTRRICAPKY
jgi:hypothetical protein